MDQQIRNRKSVKKLYLYLNITWILYTALIVFLAMHEFADLEETTTNGAIIQARTHFSKDILYRNWVTAHGGVYVPITDITQPNPYLNVPNKVIESTDGQKLTLMNPAYITRQVYEFGNNENIIRGRLTSLKPLRPQNAPDEWEKYALNLLSSERSEVIEFSEKNGKEQIKFMGAFYVFKGCLKCHAFQDYKIGDVRGGISIALSMAPFKEAESIHKEQMLINYILIWFSGMVILFIGGRKMKKHWTEIVEGETKFGKMISTMQDGIIIIDEDRKIELFNEKSEAIFGKKAIDVIGLQIGSLQKQIFSEDGLQINLDKHPANIISLGGQELTNNILGIERHDKIKKWLSLNLQTLNLDAKKKKYSVLISVRDITEKKIIENELQKYRESLENIVEDRTEELKITNKKLEGEIRKQKESELKVIKSLEKEKELSELKTRFISTASHEFRTPLTTILTSAEILDMFGPGKAKEEYQTHIYRIIHSVEYLTDLMDDVLTINRAESGKIKFNPGEMDFFQLCENIVEEIEITASEKHNIQINYNVNQKVFFMDEKLMKYMLYNLLSNAIKYSPEGGNVLLKVEKDDSYLKLSVSDEGLGIPENDKAHLFEPFHRGVNTRDMPGTGLGLSIVKKSVEMHCGNVSFESEEGKGTKFTILLPLD